MTFVRYQEFYESKYDHIRDSRFTLVEHMGAYRREYLENNDELWCYPTDWAGYNLPASVIKQVHDLGIPDPNHYDSLMLGIYGMIMCETMGKAAYIIGTYVHEGEDENAGALTMKHELTHALFATNDEYREKVLEIINSVSVELREKLIGILAKNNYPRKTALDEINAYLTTGGGGYFDHVEDELPEFDDLKASLKKLHKIYYTKFMEDDEE